MNDDMARKVVLLASKMPNEISKNIFAYLSLFRKGKNGLRWARALSIISSVNELINADKLEWDGQEKENHSSCWEKAIQMMIESPPPRLPLKNNNYLRAIAFQHAGKAEGTNHDGRYEEDIERATSRLM